MRNKVRSFFMSQKGINTVEVVIILAIMVGLAIIFRQQLADYANGLMDSVFDKNTVDFTNMSPPTQTP